MLRPARPATPVEGRVELGEDVLDVAARLADLEALADAEDRREPVPVGRLDLGVDDRVVLVVVLRAARCGPTTT